MWISKFPFARKWKHRMFINGDDRTENIINTSRVDGSGVTYTNPINFEGDAYSVRVGGGLGRTFEADKHKLSVDLDVNSGIGYGPFFINGQEGISNNTNLDGSLTANYRLIRIIVFAPR